MSLVLLGWGHVLLRLKIVSKQFLMKNINRTIVIAEAGVNHNGNLETAKKMIEVAAQAGVDYVKFQTFNSDKLVTNYADLAEYQKTSMGASVNQLEMLNSLELKEADHFELMNHCKINNVNFLSSAFDIDSAKFLEKFNLDYIKIASGLITDYPYLKYVASLKRRIILSTGMSSLNEVRDALEVLNNFGAPLSHISLLQCTTEYPAPIDEVNLRVIQELKNEFGLRVGYSDHTSGINVSLAAVAIGAEIIEKHFTLDRNMKGPDHKASLEPQELRNLVKSIREVEIALGESEKNATKSEMKNRTLARKSIVAAREIYEGEIFNEEMLTTKRPGNGISPMNWGKVIGKTAIKHYMPNDMIDME